MSIDVTLIQPT